MSSLLCQLKEKSTFQNLMFDTMSFMSFMFSKKIGSNGQIWFVNLAISEGQGFLKIIQEIIRPFTNIWPMLQDNNKISSDVIISLASPGLAETINTSV